MFNIQKYIAMTQVAMTVRMDNKQKAQFDSLCEQFGMSANTAINIFVKAVIRSKSIPFAIKANSAEEGAASSSAREAFANMCGSAQSNGVEMSLPEINEEIKAARRLIKERDGLRCD